jgi:choline dehydrogenase
MNTTVVPTEEYDYVIVGAGTAGCVVANRLTEDSRVRVLIIEAGGQDSNPWLHVPAGFYRTAHSPAYNWGYETEPVPGLDDRRILWPRGKVLGGSSSTNGLLYVRGAASDFDAWAQHGNPGWSYADVLPYFRKSENQERGESEFHGSGGPLSVSNLRIKLPLNDAFIAAGVELGYTRNDDFNGASLDGVGEYQLTVNGWSRSSAATAFLRPSLRRGNLKLVTGALAERVVMEGRRAVGLRYSVGNEVRVAKARREVVLSGGAVNSPQLLQLSGIGPGSVLRDAGVEVVHELIGVGERLQDHLTGRVTIRCKDVLSLNDIGRSLPRQVLAAFEYALLRTGPLMMGASPLGLFARSRPGLVAPDLQFFFLAGSSDKGGGAVDTFPAGTLAFNQCRPESKGWVHIASPRATDKPLIQPNYLSSPVDEQVVVAGFHLARRIFSTRAFVPYRVSEYLPGEHVTGDETLLAYARQRVGTGYHPTSSCRMGQDNMAVVDPSLRVRGIARLRVIDASIMPSIVSTNTNAATYMIAEKGADLLKMEH